MEKEMKKTKDKKPINKKKMLVICLSVLLVLLLIVLGVLIYLDQMFDLINWTNGKLPQMSEQEMLEYLNGEKETMDPDFDGEILNPEDINLDTVDGPSILNENMINILLIGQDRRPGETRARSDSMILCSYNKQKNELTMISFMRDLYVKIPGYSSHKMNSSFAWGGMSLLNDTILTNFGIEIDGDFAVDFEAFGDVIDTIGGVDINLTAAEARYINSSKYSAGVNHLDGQDALTYARIRKIGNADFERTSRQQNVINAVLEKCKKMSLTELDALLKAVLPLLSTNMEQSTILALAAELLPSLSTLKINERVRIPADGTYSFAWVSDMSVLMPDLKANRDILEELLGE